MHISLDSALGRQRRLNSVGESITQIAPDPAAAYSLRSLTGADPKVVRVRRASDNHEQDFTASDVSSGALQDFVNAQVTAPLDIQALSATGRDGDFLIAKAAYSLRSLGTRQATLAATGDTVARANGQFVCQVRRPSDDALKSFTAAEVTDGTLLSFITEEVTLVDATDFSSSIPSPLSSSTAGVLTNTFGQSIGGSDNVVLVEKTSTSTSGVPFRYLGQPNIFEGDTATLTVEVFLPNSNVSTGLRLLTSNLSSGDVHNIQITKGSWQAISVTGTMTSDSSFNNWRVQGWVDSSGNEINNANEKVYLRKYELKVKSSDGFVKTWYDQSVSDQAGTATGNHATQETAANQPKIVSAGNYLGALLFDGSDDFLLASFSNPFTSDSFTASVVNFKTTSGRETVFDYRASTPYVVECKNNQTLNVETSSPFSDSSLIITENQDNLLVTSTDSSDTLLGLDGTTANKSGRAVSSGSASLNIGRNGFGGGINDLNGDIKEIIIYSSDQRSNRTAIEANMGEVYSIDLPSGVDPGFDQVDGFVETWYDQSGNGNDLTKSTATNQPRIVSNGVLETAGDNGLPALMVVREIGQTRNMLFSSTITTSGNLSSFILASDRIYTRYLNHTSGRSTTQVGGSWDGVNLKGGANDGESISTGVTNTTNALFSLVKVGNTGTYHRNSSLRVTGTCGSTIAISALHSFPNNNAGRNHIQELIIYNSDQTANRPALETNINGHYSIF